MLGRVCLSVFLFLIYFQYPIFLESYLILSYLSYHGGEGGEGDNRGHPLWLPLYLGGTRSSNPRVQYDGSYKTALTILLWYYLAAVVDWRPVKI